MDPRATALSLALVAYNNGLNLWRRFHGRLYVPLNLAASALVLLFGAAVWSLDAAGVGLGANQGAGFGLGLVLGAVAASPLFLASRHRRAAALVADDRIAGATPRQVAYRSLVRVPLGTAVLEEVAFRGVLYAALAPGGELQAALWSSAAFGLWHVVPAFNQLRINGVVQSGRRSSGVALVAASVLATFAAGLLLVWLRIVSGGLAAPFALHAALNSLSTIAAYRANRQTEA